MKNIKLLVVDTHPIQYRAPIFRQMQLKRPDSFIVVYASDYSVRSHADAHFGKNIEWGISLVDGYPHQFLNDDRGGADRRRFGGWKIASFIHETKPSAILLNGLHNKFFISAFFCAWWLKIPIWLRVETNEVAFVRGGFKSVLRGVYYRIMYGLIKYFFYIGISNRLHFSKFGVKDVQLRAARYCVPDYIGFLSNDEKTLRASTLRKKLKIDDRSNVIGFFGKFIHKKNPDILIEAMFKYHERLPRETKILFVGSGELEGELKSSAAKLLEKTGVEVIFAGFVNQAEIADYYLVCDTVVLPSRREGETWGLVANEALHAGCSLVLSNAVGSSADFGLLKRVRIFDAENVDQLGESLLSLSEVKRSFDWARMDLLPYTVESVADEFCKAIDELDFS